MANRAASGDALRLAARTGDLAALDRLLRDASAARALNAADDSGRTPLMLAAMNGQAGSVKRLLAAGAQKTLVDRDGLDALAHARQLGFGQISALLQAAP